MLSATPVVEGLVARRLCSDVDPRALRDFQLEKIRLGFAATVEVTNLQARRDVALMVVLLSFAGTTLVASLARQLPPDVAHPVALALVLGAAAVVVRMRTLATKVRIAARDGSAAIDRLITTEEEPDDDGEEAHRG